MLDASFRRYKHNQRENFRDVYTHAHFSKVYVENDSISTVCFDNYGIYPVDK